MSCSACRYDTCPRCLVRAEALAEAREAREARARAAAPEMLALLRSLAVIDFERGDGCAMCGHPAHRGAATSAGHAPDCKLAALLARIDGAG